MGNQPRKPPLCKGGNHKGGLLSKIILSLFTQVSLTRDILWKDFIIKSLSGSLLNSARTNMTKEERHLWYDFLKDYPIKFTRQKILGKYIVDFYCAKAKLVIELDGSQHYSEEGEQNDIERTSYLNGYGFQVVRILNSKINNNFKGVCVYIDKIVSERVPIG